MMRKISVGIIGFGTIGSGVVKILQDNSDIIKKRLGVIVEVIKIADLDITTDRGIKVNPKILTTDAQGVINHPEVNVIVELIGGYEPARSLILQAINAGKHVVTANKALLASTGARFSLLVKTNKCLLDLKLLWVERFLLYEQSENRLLLIKFILLKELLMEPLIIYSVRCLMSIVVLI